MPSLLTTVFALLALCGSPEAAPVEDQQQPWWTVDLVKVKPGELDSYLRSLELNWGAARKEAMIQGALRSYAAVVLNSGKAEERPADVLLMTEYLSKAKFEQREQIFDPIRKARGTISVEGKSPRDFVQSVQSYSGSRPISSADPVKR